MEVGNVTKATTFKSFFSSKLKNHMFVTVLFNIFMRQTLNDDFWGLHKNMNYAFPLNIFKKHFKSVLLLSIVSFSIAIFNFKATLSLFKIYFNSADEIGGSELKNVIYKPPSLLFVLNPLLQQKYYVGINNLSDYLHMVNSIQKYTELMWSTVHRSTHQGYFLKKGVLGNFKKFTGKYMCQSLFFNKVGGLRPQACNFIKKETLAQMLSCEL